MHPEASSQAMFGIRKNDYEGRKREGIVRRCGHFTTFARPLALAEIAILAVGPNAGGPEPQRGATP